MKTAISILDGKISEHFGRCSEFLIVEIQNNEIISREIIQRPELSHPEVPAFLAKMGVSQVVAGGMGTRAKSIFGQVGIKTIIGVSGDTESVVCKLLDGELESLKDACISGEGHRPGESCGHRQ